MLEFISLAVLESENRLIKLAVSINLLAAFSNQNNRRML